MSNHTDRRTARAETLRRKQVRSIKYRVTEVSA